MTDNDKNTDQEVFDRRLDWAMGERGGREAPDVAGAVMARIDGQPVRSRSMNVWLAAALVVLGVSAVFAVFWAKHNDDVREAAQQQLQDPMRQRLQDLPYVVVRTRAEIEALPQDTVGVQMVGLGFDGVDALIKRCPYVRKLLLRGNEIEGGAVFRALWLKDLRHLDIVGCNNVTPNVIEEMVKDTALLQVKFGNQEWLTVQHLELLAKSGIEPMFPDSGHPMLTLAVAALICDYGEKMRARQLAEIQPIPFVVVRSIADIAALPADAQAVDGLDLEDEAVGALARLRQLRHLRLRSGAQTKVIPVLDFDATYAPRTTDGNRKSITDRGLAQLVPLQDLETLELVGTIEVKGPGLGHVARLPKLRELHLVCIDTSEEGLAFLPKFPALQRLRLERNHGFLGLQSVAECSGLRGLVIAACPQLATTRYLDLRQLVDLRELRIRQAGPDTWRNDTGRKLLANEERTASRVRQLAESSERGVTDEVLDLLVSRLPELETLELTFTAATDEGFSKLARLTELRTAVLVGNDGLTHESLRSLSPELRELDVSGCVGIDDSIGAVVRARFRQLEALRICSNGRLTDLSDIAAMKTLRVLHLRACAKLGEEAAASLRQCDHLRELDYTMSPGVSADVATYLRQRGVAVKQKFW